jgi:hypothetical protein
VIQVKAIQRVSILVQQANRKLIKGSLIYQGLATLTMASCPGEWPRTGGQNNGRKEYWELPAAPVGGVSEPASGDQPKRLAAKELAVENTEDEVDWPRLARTEAFV